jgi:hypothetical protein
MEVSVRYTALLVPALGLLALVSDTGLSQATATQSLTLSVSSVAKIAVSGNPGPLTIASGVAGTDALSSVTDASTTYSITHNNISNMRITAGLNIALDSGYKLEVALASDKGGPAGTVDISTGAAVNVVTGIPKGADAGRTITYTFSADASAGTMTSTNRTVTLTLTN